MGIATGRCQTGAQEAITLMLDTNEQRTKVMRSRWGSGPSIYLTKGLVQPFGPG